MDEHPSFHAIYRGGSPCSEVTSDKNAKINIKGVKPELIEHAIAKLSSRGMLRALESEYRRAQERGEIPPDAEILKTLAALEASSDHLPPPGPPEPPAQAGDGQSPPIL